MMERRPSSLQWLTLLVVASTSAFQSNSFTTTRQLSRTNNNLCVMQYSNIGNPDDNNDQESFRSISSKLKTKFSFSKKIPSTPEKTEDQKRIEEYLEYIRSRENRLKNARRQSSSTERKKKKKPNDFFVTKPKDYMSAAFKKKKSSKSSGKEQKQTDYNSQYMQYIDHRHDRLHTDDYSFIKSQWYDSSKGPAKENVRPSDVRPARTSSEDSSVNKGAESHAVNRLFGRRSKLRSLLCSMKQKKTLDQPAKKTRLRAFKRVSKITIGMLTTALFLRAVVTATFVIGLKVGFILA